VGRINIGSGLGYRQCSFSNWRFSPSGLSQYEDRIEITVALMGAAKLDQLHEADQK
jgi:hypothetical protein